MLRVPQVSYLRIFASYGILALWLSSWIPVPLDSQAVATIALCLGLLTLAFGLGNRPARDARDPSDLLASLALMVASFGALFAVLVGAIGTSGEMAVLLFKVCGWVGFLLLLSSALGPAERGPAMPRIGETLLLALALLSWGSAFSMHSHRGATVAAGKACILIPSGMARYGTELTSLWSMRFPDVLSHATGPTGTVILNYHAILLIEGAPQLLYNWSKKAMRFVPLEQAKNPWLPQTCPE